MTWIHRNTWPHAGQQASSVTPGARLGPLFYSNVLSCLVFGSILRKEKLSGRSVFFSGMSVSMVSWEGMDSLRDEIALENEVFLGPQESAVQTYVRAGR